MKKEQREPYLFLCNFPEDGWGLCNSCKYAEWNGWSCCEAHLDCKHPLADHFFPIEPCEVWGLGHDCWGFRPSESLQVIGIKASIRFMNRIPIFRDGEWLAMEPYEI